MVQANRRHVVPNVGKCAETNRGTRAGQWMSLLLLRFDELLGLLYGYCLSTQGLRVRPGVGELNVSCLSQERVRLVHLPQLVFGHGEEREITRNLRAVARECRPLPLCRFKRGNRGLILPSPELGSAQGGQHVPTG